MEIISRDFGILKIDEKEIIHFKEGLFAFEEFKDYVLIEKDGYKQKWLQSIAAETPRFIIFDPDDIVTGYRPTLSSEIRGALQITDQEEPAFYVVAVVPANVKDMSVNLKSPIVLNRKKNLAMQVILEKENYPIRHLVFQEEKGEA